VASGILSIEVWLSFIPRFIFSYFFLSFLYLTVKRGVGGVKGKTGKSVYTAVIMKFVISGRHFDKLAKCGLKLGAKG
jgi:hypothetical protein